METLDRAPWPLGGEPERVPCRLAFPAPLRILRGGSLVASPALPDIVASLLRRLAAYLPPDGRATLGALRSGLMAATRSCQAQAWEGTALDLIRYSARQEREIELRGVAGSLVLRQGPGPFWPLLAAGQWLHVGKGTVFGLGQLLVRRSSDANA